MRCVTCGRPDFPGNGHTDWCSVVQKLQEEQKELKKRIELLERRHNDLAKASSAAIAGSIRYGSR